MTTQTFKLPEDLKRALALVAVDKDRTPSDLLRECVEEVVKGHKDGFFLEIAARDDVQQPVRRGAKRGRKPKLPTS